MINLEELGLKLNRALEEETKEGLTNWLLNKRLSSYMASIGTENISELKPTNGLVSVSTAYCFDIQSQTVKYNTCSDMAA